MQFVASSFGEFGIQGQYLDGELYLVGDALPSEVFARPQFEIRKLVVQSVAVFVMYAFLAKQRATDMLRHYFAMLENLLAATFVQSTISRRVDVSFGGNGTPRAAFPATFLAAKFLPLVVTGMLAVFRFHKAAFFGLTAQLALKSRDGFLVHVGQLPDSFAAVKGVN